MSTQNTDEAVEQQAAVESTTQPVKNAPVHKGIYKGVAWSVFAKTVTLRDGEAVTVYSTVVEARYRGKDGVYRSTSAFTENQLAAIEDAACDARRFIREQRANRKSEK